ncbi:T9SS type A sorting domain-containing protein [bacterium]|nr:T9SS type A sorting domain-containing protein [bacterium]
MLLLAAAGVTASAQTRLLLVGDSITEGKGSDNGLGFRDDLSALLRQSGIPMLFEGPVGEYPYRGHFFPGALIGDFYWGNGGFGTYDTGLSMDRHHPDYVFIHLGTNGIEGGGAFGTYTSDGGLTLRDDTLPGRLANLLAYLVMWKRGPRGRFLKNIIISRIIDKPAYHAGIDAFNAEIARLYHDSEAGVIPAIPPGTLRLADHYSEFDTASMFSPDSIHPNDAGYGHMAAAYMRAVHLLPMRLEHYSNPVISGLLNNAAPEMIMVRLTDDHGDPVYAADVRFEVVSGAAYISGSASVKTDTSGLAGVGIATTEPGLSVIRAHSFCLRDSVVDFTVSAEKSVGIDGYVLYGFDDMPVSGVGIKWVERNRMVDTTDAAGQFRYQLFPHQSSVTLAPVRERLSCDSSGIIMYDAALAARDAVGIETLNGIAANAADVDGDGSVSMKDAALIARYTVGIVNDPDSRAGYWKFDPDTTAFPVLEDNVPGLEITGILMGDLHGGWMTQGAGKRIAAAGLRSEIAIEAGRTVLRVHADHESLLSLDAAVEYDPARLELVSVSAGDPDFRVFTNAPHPGVCRLGMFSPQAVSLGNAPVLSISFAVLPGYAGAEVDLRRIHLNDEIAGDISAYVPGGETDEPGSTLAVSNYPNPFNGGTLIRYALGERADVTVVIYNYLGQRVHMLVSGRQEQGEYTIGWDGRDERGRELPSGIYFCVVQTKAGVKQVRKMELIR